METPFMYDRRQAARMGAGMAMLLATSPAALAQPTAPDPRVSALADRYQERLFRLFPMDATENTGDPAFEGLLEIDIAPAHRVRQRALYQWLQAELRKIDPKPLARQDRLTWDLLDYEARTRFAQLAFPWHLLPLNHQGMLPVTLANWAGGEGAQPMKTVANYEHFLQRLQKVPAWVDQAIANMEQGLARGVTLPQALVERTLPTFEFLMPQDPYESPFLAGVRNFPETVPAAARDKLAGQYRVLVFDHVNHALRRLRSFLAGRYLPQARKTSGLGALPGGAEWYRASVQWSTTTSMTPREVHELGLREVQRIRAELAKVQSRFGHAGSLDDFLAGLPGRPELKPFKTEEQVLAAYRAINEQVKKGLPLLFERAPKAPLEVRAVEPMRRDTASDHYVPPAEDGSRPGAFYAVIQDPADYLTVRMAALFLHEGQPGHHFHIALQQELSLPRFRRSVWYDAFGEGWALYAEGLGRELGLYEDTTHWLGRLLMELHRALRLVVDTGLHELGWTRERAIAYLREMEGTSEDSARRAIERYMAWPGQALAYKVGELKLLQLRERCRTRLGARFDIRAFHSQVLGDGSMPLRMLEARIDAWLESQR